ncbi:hypothetical protein G7054_g6204 [Neopestalotiopsis clavispora]|nr:hypothetical protein G7054_g6204 [Neopestalotiopsis clavispora]
MDSFESSDYDTTIDETPVLRIWGVFRVIEASDSEIAPQGGQYSDVDAHHPDCVVHLDHHDHGDSDVDLTRQDWYEDLGELSYTDIYIDSKTTARYFPPRLDKFCHELSWQPYITTIYHEVDSKTWIPIMLVLFNEARPSHRNIYCAPELKLLQEAVSHYLNKLRRKDSASEPDMDPHSLAHRLQPKIATALSRGRRKRAARRHTDGYDRTSVMPEDFRTKTMVQPSPSINVKFRGRVRRQRKRHQMQNICTGKNFTYGEDTNSPSTRPVRSETSDFMSIESKTNEKPYQLPQLLQHLPVITIWPLGKKPVAIPVCGDGLTVKGFVVAPKPKFDDDDEHKLEAAKFGLVGSVLTPNQIPSTYWNKFPIFVNSLLRQECRRNYDPDFTGLGKSLQWSYKCSILLSPDYTLGPFADEMEYAQQYFFPSSKPPLGEVETEPRETNDAMRWPRLLGYESRGEMRAWSSLHLDIIKDNNSQEDAAASALPPNIPRNKPVDPTSLKKTVGYFASAMDCLEKLDRGDRLLEVSSSRTSQKQRLQESMNESSSISGEENLEQAMSEYQLRIGTHEADDNKNDKSDPQRDLIRDHDGSAVQISIDGSPQSASSEDYSFGYVRYKFVDDTYSIKEMGDLGKPKHTFIQSAWDRDLFHVGNYLALVPLRDQECHARRLKQLACNVTQHADIRAHAVFQFSLCLLTGSGVPENRELGLSWFWSASMSGSRVARAVVQRLFNAYGEKLPEPALNSQWLAEETRNGSAWAMAELTVEDAHDHSVAQYNDKLRREAASMPVMKDLGLDHLDRLLCQLKAEYPVQSSTSALIDGIKIASESGPWFFGQLLTWACCSASAEAFSRLFQFWQMPPTRYWSPDPAEQLYDYLVLALQAGRADIAHIIMDHRLARQERLEKSRVNCLFFLLNIEDDQVDMIVQAITRLGGDPNQAVGLDDASVLDNGTFGYPFHNDRGFSSSRYEHLKFMPNGLSITPLRWAIMNHKASGVNALLSCGATFPMVPSAQTHAELLYKAFAPKLCNVATLGTACYDLEIIQLFLDRHGHQTAQTVFAETPLGAIVTEFDDARRRIRLGKLATREYLFPVLDKLRSFQSKSDPELFRAAVMNGHLEIVEYLIKEAGIDIECRCAGLTPLHTAALYGRETIFTYLLDNGADVSAVTTRKGISLAHLIFWKPKPAPLELYMLNRLAQAGADVLGSSSPFGSKVSPLHLAVLGSRVEGVAWLLELGASRSETMNEEVMPFVRGARFTHWGIDRDKRTGSRHFSDYPGETSPVPVSLCGYTPVGLALHRWDIHDPEDLLRLLKLLCMESHDLRDFYTRPVTKETVLHTIACYPFLCGTGIWEYVLQQGSASGLHINVPDALGDTPLHWAQVMRGSTDGIMVDDLLALGADPSIRNFYDMTPEDIRLWFYLHPDNHKGHQDNLSVLLMALGEHTQREFDHPMHDMVYKDARSVHDGDFSRLWSTLCDGVTFQSAWDFQSGSWLEYDKRYLLRANTHAHDDPFLPFFLRT